MKIFDVIKPGVITGNDIKIIFDIAKKNNFAIPAINCIGIDSINASLETASKLRSPIIIQFSYGGSIFIAGKGLKINNHISAALGAISGAIHIHNIAEYYNIPVIIHTDHCSKKFLPWIDYLLDVGEKYFISTGKPLFSSHMVDLSKEPIKNNIKISAKYLRRMSKLNMTLEIELGCTGGEEDGIDNTNINLSSLYTQPKDVSYAYEKLSSISSNFTIAASFGNIHGVYKNGTVKLMPKILYESQKYVSKKFSLPEKTLNFVFHGGSGSSLEEIKESINYGVVKMNIDTDTQWYTWKGVLKYYKKNKQFLQKQLGNPKGINIPNKKFYDPRIWIRFGQKSMIKCLERYFFLLNAVNVL